MTTTTAEHAIRVRTVLDLVAAAAIDEGVLADALDALGILDDRTPGEADTYAAVLLDLDTRARYLRRHGPDAVDAYLTEEELTAALKAHAGDKGALADRMLEDVEAQLAERIAACGPAAEPSTLRPGTVAERLLPRYLEELTAAEDRVAELEATARDVVTDYAPTSCDDLDRCACSMGRLYRRLTGVSLDASVGGLG